MKAYEAALTADATIPPCEPLHALLRDAAEKDVPISSLSLRSVPLGRLGARALAAVLQVDSFITFANLEDTGIGDEGTVAVTEALRTHPTLFRLDLGYNGVGGKGIKAISALLLDSPSLLCLDLSGNNLYSRISLVAPAALAPFASALAPLGKALGSVRCKLQLLHLDHADIEHKGARHAGSCRAAAPQTILPSRPFSRLPTSCLRRSHGSRRRFALERDGRQSAAGRERSGGQGGGGARKADKGQPHHHLARPARE